MVMYIVYILYVYQIVIVYVCIINHLSSHSQCHATLQVKTIKQVNYYQIYERWKLRQPSVYLLN